MINAIRVGILRNFFPQYMHLETEETLGKIKTDQLLDPSQNFKGQNFNCNGREILTCLCFCGKRLIFYYLQYKKVVNLSSEFRRTEIFTRTNYGNSYLQRYHRIHHENY